METAAPGSSALDIPSRYHLRRWGATPAFPGTPSIRIFCLRQRGRGSSVPGNSALDILSGYCLMGKGESDRRFRVSGAPDGGIMLGITELHGTSIETRGGGRECELSVYGQGHRDRRTDRHTHRDRRTQTETQNRGRDAHTRTLPPLLWI